MPAGGLPALEASVTALGGKINALQTELTAEVARLDAVLLALGQANGNGAQVPALIEQTTALAGRVHQVVDALTAWSQQSVSQTYIQNQLP